MNHDEQSDSFLTQESYDLLKTLRERIHTIESIINKHVMRDSNVNCFVRCFFAYSDSEGQSQTILS